jgi:3-methyladenine DNA glycosylase Mpg
LRRLTSGPGRLSQALGITRQQHNGQDLCSRAGGLYIANSQVETELAAENFGGLVAATRNREPSMGEPRIGEPRIIATPRINVTRAPHHEYRFLLAGNPFVSAKRA